MVSTRFCAGRALSRGCGPDGAGGSYELHQLDRRFHPEIARAAAYALVGGLAFAETALLVGFVLPGETAVLLGWVLAYQHKVSLPLIAAVAVLAAITGERRLRSRSALRGPAAQVPGIRQTSEGPGKRAASTAGQRRTSGLLRPVHRLPPGSHARHGRHRPHALPQVSGVQRRRRGLVWALGFTMLGYLAGASYQRIEKIAGNVSLIILAVVVIAIVLFLVRRRRRERDSPSETIEVDQP